MEIECHAPDDHSIALWVEPWGDEIQIAPATRARLIFDGEIIESLVVKWIPEGLWLGLPRHALLRVLADSGAVLGEYDTKLLPPTPPGTRPI